MLSNKETSGTIDFTLSSLKPFQGEETVQEGLGRACFFPWFPSLSSLSFTIIHPTFAGRQSRKVTEPCLLLSPAKGKGHTGAGHPDILKAHRRRLEINILHSDQVGPIPGDAQSSQWTAADLVSVISLPGKLAFPPIWLPVFHIVTGKDINLGEQA